MIHQPRSNHFLVNGRSRAPQILSLCRRVRAVTRDPWIRGSLVTSALWLAAITIAIITH